MYSEKWVKTQISLTIRVESQLLKGQQSYSSYQKFLYELCLKLKNKGYGYRRISYILNGRGYKSVRGKVFKNGHVQSLLNKGKVRKDRLSSLKSHNDYKLKVIDSKLRFLDV